MIAAIKYKCIGSETKGVADTLVQIQAASGYEMIDVLLNGISQEFGVGVAVDNETGNLLFPSLLVRGDDVLALFKQQPSLAEPEEDISSGGGTTMIDFSEDDFSSDDFL